MTSVVIGKGTLLIDLETCDFADLEMRLLAHLEGEIVLTFEDEGSLSRIVDLCTLHPPCEKLATPPKEPQSYLQHDPTKNVKRRRR